MSNQTEDTPEVRRNRILGDAIGLTIWEVAEFVTSIQKKDSIDEYIIHFSIQTPESVLAKVTGIQGGLFVHTRPIDFEGLQISKI
jgi:hypothetical protein